MKVLHVIPSVADIRGGPSQAIVGMVRALNESGIDAEIATTNDAGPETLNVPLGRLVNHMGVPTRFFPRFSPPIAAIREFACSPPFARWLAATITQFDILHVHALFSFVPTCTMAFARRRGIPYITRPLGLLNVWSLAQSAARKQAYLGLIERRNLNGSGALHFTAAAEQSEVERLGLTCPGFVLPLGLDIAADLPQAARDLRERLGLTRPGPVILFLSRVHPKKGLDILIPALGAVRDLPFTFVLAGSGDREYERQVEGLIERHGLGDRCVKTGFVQGELKQLLLQGADLFVLPSHSENFGIVVAEALAAGLPMVVTPGVALSSLVKEKSFGLVVDLNESAVAGGIRQFLCDPTKFHATKILAKHLARDEFSWRAVAKRLKLVYEAIGSRQAPPQFSAFQ